MIFYKKYYILFIIFLVAGLFNSYGQSDCSTALPLCTNADSGGIVNGFGKDDFNMLTESGCLGTGLGVNTIETNSYWFRIKLAESGEFGFNIIPNDLSEDWDFAIYGPGYTCGALVSPVACNFSKTSPSGYTGVGFDPNSGTQTAAYDSWMNVTAGDEYVILVNQYSGNNSGFAITWQGAVVDNNSDPLNCDILVDLGDDKDLCIGESELLNATTFGSSISYEWFLKNETTGIFESMSITTATLTVTTSGTYKVEVTDNTSGEPPRSDEVVILFHTIPTASVVGDLVSCDANGDGVEDFNLESQTPLIINGQTGMTVTYHESENFAIAGSTPLASPYSSNGTTIWARIQNTFITKCFDIISFDIALAAPPIAYQPPDLLECDDNNDGNMIFNLDIQTPIVLNGQVGIVTYYDSETKAIDRKGWILDTDTYKSGTKTVWVRIEPSTGSLCYGLTSFELEVLESAVANLPTDIQVCDFNNDGLSEFDFKTLKDSEILGIQDPATFDVNYFATLADANNNTNILPEPYTNVTAYAYETIYARIQNKKLIECYDITSFTLQVFDTAFPPTPENNPDLVYCDDMSDGDDTNGFLEFDLTEQETIILNGQSPLVFDVTYFEDSGYTNQIVNTTAFTNSLQNEQIIYVRVTNSNQNNVSCSSDTSFIIKVEPLPFTLLTPFEFKQCDEDGVPDGLVDFRLSEADVYVTLGNALLNVSYHVTFLDATSGINTLNKDSFSNGISSTLYARVESALGCYRIVQVDLIVSVTSFPPNYLHEIVECDTDGSNDGFYEFNLTQATSEIITLFPSQNLRVSYFRNQSDALSESNFINPANAYWNETVNSQLIWVRVESSIDGGCYGVAPVLQLTVNSLPEFELDETGIVCLNNAPLSVSPYNAQGEYTYEWLNDSGNAVSQQGTINIFQAGVYTVIATSNLNCDSFPKQITITESVIADISLEDIQIIDNSGNNSITITTDNQNLGIGDYEFAMDNRDGPYQDDPFFDKVSPGQHTLFVRDKNNCGIADITVQVFGFPNFFTPNDDGINDTWNIKGVDTSLFADSRIFIYNRYGKLLASFGISQPGWDGMYNDKQVNSSDYWYLAEIVDFNGIVSTYKGHFSLVRK
jgi:gliding motility-associated-like protein